MNPELLREYIEKPTPLPKIIVVYGPTASGKSAMAVEVAKVVNRESKIVNGKMIPYDTHIISADSRQVYRRLDIGTGKVTEDEMQ